VRKTILLSVATRQVFERKLILTYIVVVVIIKVKVGLKVFKGRDTCYSVAYMSRLEQQHFTISEVAADWHELMIPWRIMRPSVARDREQLDPRCSTQTYHRPDQRTRLSPRSP